MTPLGIDLRDLKASVPQLVLQNARGNPVSSPIRRYSFWRPRLKPEARPEIDNDQPPTWTQRLQDTGIGLKWLGQVMVHPNHVDRIAASRREIAAVGHRFDDTHIMKSARADPITNAGDLIAIDLRSVNVTAWADSLGRGNRDRSIAGSNLGNR